MISIIRRLLGRPSSLDILEKHMGISFKNRQLLIEALTHSSYAREHKNVPDNERLEFLGDAVVQLIATEQVFEEPEGDEGWMTRTRAALVCGDGLLRIAKVLELSEHVLLGKGEKKSGGGHKKKILEDCVESIVGAIYQDKGLKAARKFLRRFWNGCLEPLQADHKTLAQEMFQREKGTTPRYRVIETSGPAHARRFVVEMVIGGEVAGRGGGTSIKAAEQAAAKDALAHRPSPGASTRSERPHGGSARSEAPPPAGAPHAQRGESRGSGGTPPR